MAESITIARPYAKAAFSAAKASNALSTWSEMLNTASAISSDETMRQVIDHPSLTAQQKAAMFAEVCGDSMSAEGQNLLTILSENDRLSALPDVAALFEQFKALSEQSVDIEVESAFELSEAQEQSLTNSLATYLDRKVILSSTTNESLIGGAIVRAEDLVIDASLKGKIAKLADSLGM